jgi:peptidoglycan-associated lipoprotein
MMRLRTFRPALLVLAFGLVSCGNTEIYRDWTQEVGASLDEGGFGDPTMNNIRRHNGEDPFVYDLNERFAREVPTTVTFAFNSARLEPSAYRTLMEQAAFIRAFPEARFRVYGHTDAVGSEAYNKQLGLRRARAVVNYLVSQGISRSRLEAMVSFGETQPVVFTQDRERRNRRTVTEVSGFVSTHPLVMDGKYGAIVYREYTGGSAGGDGGIAGLPTGGGEGGDG